MLLSKGSSRRRPRSATPKSVSFPAAPTVRVIEIPRIDPWDKDRFFYKKADFAVFQQEETQRHEKKMMKQIQAMVRERMAPKIEAARVRGASQEELDAMMPKTPQEIFKVLEQLTKEEAANPSQASAFTTRLRVDNNDSDSDADSDINDEEDEDGQKQNSKVVPTQRDTESVSRNRNTVSTSQPPVPTAPNLQPVEDEFELRMRQWKKDIDSRTNRQKEADSQTPTVTGTAVPYAKTAQFERDPVSTLGNAPKKDDASNDKDTHTGTTHRESDSDSSDDDIDSSASNDSDSSTSDDSDSDSDSDSTKSSTDDDIAQAGKQDDNVSSTPTHQKSMTKQARKPVAARRYDSMQTINRTQQQHEFAKKYVASDDDLSLDSDSSEMSDDSATRALTKKNTATTLVHDHDEDGQIIPGADIGDDVSEASSSSSSSSDWETESELLKVVQRRKMASNTKTSSRTTNKQSSSAPVSKHGATGPSNDSPSDLSASNRPGRASTKSDKEKMTAKTSNSSDYNTWSSGEDASSSSDDSSHRDIDCQQRQTNARNKDSSQRRAVPESTDWSDDDKDGFDTVSSRSDSANTRSSSVRERPNQQESKQSKKEEDISEDEHNKLPSDEEVYDLFGLDAGADDQDLMMGSVKKGDGDGDSKSESAKNDERLGHQTKPDPPECKQASVFSPTAPRRRPVMNSKGLAKQKIRRMSAPVVPSGSAKTKKELPVSGSSHEPRKVKHSADSSASTRSMGTSPGTLARQKIRRRPVASHPANDTETTASSPLQAPATSSPDLVSIIPLAPQASKKKDGGRSGSGSKVRIVRSSAGQVPAIKKSASWSKISPQKPESSSSVPEPKSRSPKASPKISSKTPKSKTRDGDSSKRSSAARSKDSKASHGSRRNTGPTKIQSETQRKNYDVSGDWGTPLMPVSDSRTSSKATSNESTRRRQSDS